MPTATNPYNLGVASKPIHDLDVTSQFSRYKQDEETHKAPQVLPFNFNAANELMSTLFQDLIALRKMFVAAENNSQVKSKNLTPIYKVIDNIGEEITQTIPELLDNLKL
jgi:hypothetical protein